MEHKDYNIKNDRQTSGIFLAATKMYQDSLSDFQCMRDRLLNWKKALNDSKVQMHRDFTYLKDIAIKSIEEILKDLVNERKDNIENLNNQIEQLINVINTSIECTSASIMEFEKQVYQWRNEESDISDFYETDYNKWTNLDNSRKSSGYAYWTLSRQLKISVDMLNPFNKQKLKLPKSIIFVINPNKLICNSGDKDAIILNPLKEEALKNCEYEKYENYCIEQNITETNEDNSKSTKENISLSNNSLHGNKKSKKVSGIKDKRNVSRSSSESSISKSKKETSEYQNLIYDHEVSHGDISNIENEYSLNYGTNDELQKTIKDYANLYAEYLINQSLSKIPNLFT
ncbi:uncharacterized protein CMU_038960 [Cryptosporidium muris RN66]|uniref:Uncharacterized protein n=1 Tax=Cryptosporidium muris (strain RN66) TaxID=441375 RepID=B6A9D8_CRYMR|nr:uncharacterized protein CMU_038960 [Cryptosporidium muris RN66]EEA04829.1 hypothetical protein, conserved [Cryptosporidium muris RN66]|eukprot:XP_002139178.1 hypothetical protein [Cryptosporidium muris RN66]